MQLTKNILWVYVIAFLFIALNAIFLIKENLLFNLVPLAILFILFAIFSLKRLIYIIVFFVPLSIPLKEIIPGLDFDMFLPTEPLMAGVLILFLFKLLIERRFDNRILNHPITIAIFINLLWILFTTITSSLPLVSLKFLLARLWFLAVFYFIATQIFKDFKEINKFYWLYIIPLLLVIFYTVGNHFTYGLVDQKAAHHVMTPFYNDHTSYGAILAMYIVIAIGLIIYPKYNVVLKSISWIILAILIFAIIFSYTRAAWISLVGTLGIYIIVFLKVKLRTILIGFTGLLVLFFMFQTEIFMSLESNRQDSSTDMAKHIQSISNISSDASNLERINRWSSAIRMFNEKPFLGWGPGTYQFNYAPFQFSYEKTIISTNAGDMGNAHSEYIGPMAESGILGMITFVLIIIATSYTALKVYYRAVNKEVKILSIISFLALCTYFIHGFLNNFLDTDKASAPFWGFIAIIVALDVYHNNSGKEKVEKNANENIAESTNEIHPN